MISDSIQARMEVSKPNLIQLYSFNTPNGIKVAACLEELVELRRFTDQFDYEPHTINLKANESRMAEFRAKINPNAKIPAIVDPHGPHGAPTAIFESGAILLYLSEKYNELMPADPAIRCQVIEWLFWASTNFSTQVKHFGFYYKYCRHRELAYCTERYAKETVRLLGVLENQLRSHGKHWVTGDAYTIADIAIWPWLNALYTNYDNAHEEVFGGFKDFPAVLEWYGRCMARPASQRSLDVTRMD